MKPAPRCPPRLCVFNRRPNSTVPCRKLMFVRKLGSVHPSTPRHGPELKPRGPTEVTLGETGATAPALVRVTDVTDGATPRACPNIAIDDVTETNANIKKAFFTASS